MYVFQQNQTLTMMTTLSAKMIYDGVCSQYYCKLIPLVSIFVASVVYEIHNLAPVGQFFPEPRFPNIKSSS